MSVTPSKAGFGDSDWALSEHLTEEIQRRILLGEYPVGSWLRHGALAEEYGVSRTPVREALRILQSRGAVEIERNRGARVRAPSPRDMRDLADVRAELEGYAAQLATERIRDEQLAELDAGWEAFREAVEKFIEEPDGAERDALGQRWLDANKDVHDLIRDAAGNRQLRNILEDVYRRLPPNVAYSALSGDSRLLMLLIAEHDQIAETIRHRDAQAAREAMYNHIRNSGRLIARWVEDQYEDGTSR